MKKTQEKILNKTVVKEEKPKKKKFSISQTIVTRDSDTRLPVRKCTHCNGTGRVSDTKGHITFCDYCKGSGYVYQKLEKPSVGKSVNEGIAYANKVSKEMAKQEAVKNESTETPKSKNVTNKVKMEVEDLEKHINNLSYKFLLHDKSKYMISKELMINSLTSNVESDEQIEDCLDKLLQDYYKLTGFDTLDKILKNKTGVLGVRYKIEGNCQIYSLSKKVIRTDYIVSGLKLSNRTWIDSRYLKIFKNHRFVYINATEAHKPIPVLCVNKSSNKLDGMIMPLERVN